MFLSQKEEALGGVLLQLDGRGKCSHLPRSAREKGNEGFEINVVIQVKEK
jgi:hypothetical protein